MSSDLELVTTRQFDGFSLDCYVDPKQEDKGAFWATREQIGRLLEYSDPDNAITVIHKRNKDRLDKFSTGVKLTQVEGNRSVTREVIAYSFKGLLEICRYSNQPNANAVIDVLWEIADEIRRTGRYSIRKSPEEITANKVESVRAILETAGITGNQAALALDKMYISYTGRSALKSCGIELVAPQQCQALTPSELAELAGIGKGKKGGRKVNQILLEAGYQRKIPNSWEPTEKGKPYAVILDVNKSHSDGVPVRQIKWTTEIIKVLERLFLQEASA